MSFEERIGSVERELMRSGPSQLTEETGRSTRQWQHYSNEFCVRIWPHDRTDVVKTAAFVSAIYEWAAQFFESIGDVFSYSMGWRIGDGHHFHQEPGSGPSVGPFQGYAEMGRQAIVASPRLRQFLVQHAEISDAGIDRLRESLLLEFNFSGSCSGRTRLPGPIGSNSRACDHLERFLNSYETAAGAFMSLIAKVALTVRVATEMREEAPTAWRRLPDMALQWAIVAHESEGGEQYYIDRLERKVREALQWRDPRRGPPIVLSDIGGEDQWRLRRTFRALEIPWLEQFNVIDLRPAGTNRPR